MGWQRLRDSGVLAWRGKVKGSCRLDRPVTRRHDLKRVRHTLYLLVVVQHLESVSWIMDGVA